jgi:mono/diheme cytochrome c family protein
MSYTLRDLPLPVKVVASVFLMAVGVGYGSAMVQLHMQDSKSGQPMPTVDDVIEKFTGKVKYDPANPPPAPVSRLEALVAGPENVAICGQTMAPAFTKEDRAKGELKYANAIKGKSEKEVEGVKAQRRGEQAAVRLWINAPEEQRKAAYAADRFEPPAGKAPDPVTPAFKDGGAIKIKSILDNRCATCHSKGGEKDDPDLTTYAGFAKFIGKAEGPKVVNGYIKVKEPLSITKLTQSTHAHLLSFATLFSLTGLIFAFSSYPKVARVVLGPWVVIAVFADVSLWWLARLSDEWGPYFAMGVIATGGAAGLGVAAQIVLSLFNMYGTKGKAALVLLFALAGGIGGLLWVNKIQPELERKMKESQCPPQPDGKGAGNVNAQGGNGGSGQSGGSADKKADDGKPHAPVNDLDRLLTLPVRDAEGKVVGKPDFNGGETGTMTRALFDKDKSKVYQKLMDDPAVPQAEKDRLKARRQAELDALAAWVRSPDAPRKLAYETDSFEAPATAPKLDPQFVKDGKVKMKAIIDARCAGCHSPEGKQADYPLTNYEELSKYLKPIVPAAAAPPPATTPTPAKAVTPIPAAKDD